MLLSLLLTLTPTTSTRLEGFYGRQVQAWFLSQISRHDPDLAQKIHAGSGPKPYTVSSLIVPDVGRREGKGALWLIPNQECQLRITSLSNPLSELLLANLIDNLPDTMRLKWTEFKTLGLAEDNSWARQTTFGELVQEFSNRRADPRATLKFASPTAFRSQGVDLSLPTPDQVWRSLWWRWNTFAPDELQIDPFWPEFAASCIVVKDFQLRSMKATFKKGEKGAATGCTGQATYCLLSEKNCGEFAPFRPGAEKVLRTLAEFALYSGVGHHTTIGMGQTRLIATR